MDYIFGTVTINGFEYENLKTVGEQHTDFSGFCTVKREYSDNHITDTFKVIQKYKTDEVGDVKYDWYIIESHNRIMDRYTPAERDIQDSIADLDAMVVDMTYDNLLNELEV